MGDRGGNKRGGYKRSRKIDLKTEWSKSSASRLKTQDFWGAVRAHLAKNVEAGNENGKGHFNFHCFLIYYLTSFKKK